MTGMSYGSLRISYCKGSKPASCGHIEAITVCGDHAKMNDVFELLRIYECMTPDEREGILAYARMTPDEREAETNEIVKLEAAQNKNKILAEKLKKSEDVIVKLLATIELLKLHIIREDGPNTPPSRSLKSREIKVKENQARR